MTDETENNIPEEDKEEEETGNEIEEKEGLEIEKEAPRPWEKVELEQEERIIQKYQEKMELEEETQEFLGSFLDQEVERRIADFAKEWFERHKEELGEEGLSINISDERKVAYALERGALQELKKDREAYEPIENLNVLKVDLQKEYIPIESQYLLLNLLEKRSRELEREIRRMARKKTPLSEIEIRNKLKELEDVFRAKKELAQKVSGRNLEEEAKSKIESQPDFKPKEAYVQENLEREKENQIKSLKEKLFGKDWEKLSEKEKQNYQDLESFSNRQIERQKRKLQEMGISLKEKEILALLDAGYDLGEIRKKRGLFQRRIEIRKGEVLTQKEFNQLVRERTEDLAQKIEKRAKKELGDLWERDYQVSVREEIEKRIKEFSVSPERAIEGIEGMYEKVKRRLISEFLERDLKKEPKSREELRKIEAEFNRKGVNLKDFVEDVISRKKELEHLTGDLERDKENLSAFLERYNLKVDKETLGKLISPEKYKKEVRKEKGFLMLLLEFILDLLSYLASPRKKESPSQKPSKP